MKRFQEVVEDEFARFFDAERANLIIVNRYKKEMYRVVLEKNEFKMKIFNLDQGIAGFVVLSAQTCIADCVEDDTRFLKEIDDPKGEKATAQIIAVPV